MNEAIIDLPLLGEQTRELTEKFIGGQSPENQAIIQQAFEQIAATPYGDNALKAGDQAKNFELTNAAGGKTSLRSLLQRGPVVLSFYRGGWCPYCSLEFRALNQILPELKSLGANLVGISPELPDSSMSTVEKHGLEFEVLSDVGNRVARDYGIVMDVPAVMRPLYLEWGLDVPAANGDDTWELPVPATYIIGADGKVMFADVNKNYTERLEPAIILETLRG